MGNDLKSDLRKTTKKLESILKEFESKEVKKILGKAARPTRKAARALVKDAKKPVKRYPVSNGKRKPKGQGKVIAIYNPGNLRRSIKILRFRRSRMAVFVGPEVGKKSSNEYGKTGQPVDGWYAHMIEFGTINFPGSHYMSRAFSKTKGQVVHIAADQIKKRTNRFKRKNKL